MGAEADRLCRRLDVVRAVGRVVPGVVHLCVHRGVDREVHHVHHDLDHDCRVGNRVDYHGVDCRAGHLAGLRAVELDLVDPGQGDFVGAVAVSTARGAAVGLRSLRHPSFLPGLRHR